MGLKVNLKARNPGEGGAKLQSQRLHTVAAKFFDEFKRLFVIFLYLWAILGLFVLNQIVILGAHRISYSVQGFAIINAFVLAKFVLVAEDLKLGHRFHDRPLIYPVAYKALVFAVLLIAVYTLEKVLVGLFAGKTVAESIPEFGGGTLKAWVCVWAFLFITLIPFFVIREIGRVIGEHELWNLMFRRGSAVYRLTSSPRQP